MNISIKILCVGLSAALSLGSMHGMRPAGRTRGRHPNAPTKVVRRPVQTPPQGASVQEQEDYEVAYALQLQQVQEESALDATQEQLKRDEEFAKRLQEGSDGEDDETYDESESQVDNAQLMSDEEFARRMQAGYDAENNVPQAPLRDTPPPAAPTGGVPVANEDAGECVICNDAQANVWLLCCSKKDICNVCFKEHQKRDTKCPFCRNPQPEVICECIECINFAKSKNL